MDINYPTLLESSLQLAEDLKDRLGRNEAKSQSRWLIEYVTGKPYLDILFSPEISHTEKSLQQFTELANQMREGAPVQYVTGYSEFYGRIFKVNPSVLIPRPETEELVEWIYRETRQSTEPLILDIGTGSGCIAITISLERPHARVAGLDVSQDALEVAALNAKKHKGDVEFIQADIRELPETRFSDLDIIVSNPPYVPLAEKEQMAIHVKEHEPHIALFPEGDDPLLYYKVISERATSWLKPGGKLFFEIHYSMGGEIEALLAAKGFKEVQVRQDLSGKDRMLMAIWP